MTARAHMVVRGLVQGVGFRWFVARRANALGLTGYARNLIDGAVEIEAEGDRSLVEALIGDVRVGPRSAHVQDLMIAWKEPSHESGQFIIR
jgi:acylphosphatase